MTASYVKTAPVIKEQDGGVHRDDLHDDSLFAVRLDRTAIWLDQQRGARMRGTWNYNGVGKKLAVLYICGCKEMNFVVTIFSGKNLSELGKACQKTQGVHLRQDRAAQGRRVGGKPP